jgi:hypothetical protein
LLGDRITTKAGDLTVLDNWIDHDGCNKRRRYKVMCVCGRHFNVWASSIIYGLTHSCGCYRSKRNTKHGHHRTPTYIAWCNMNTTVKRKLLKYDVKVCQEWSCFDAFIKDMGIRPEGYKLSRIDKKDDFKLSNCKWVLIKENNK